MIGRSGSCSRRRFGHSIKVSSGDGPHCGAWSAVETESGQRCNECGFLARRGIQAWGGNRAWFEVYPEMRIDPALAVDVPLGFDNRQIPAELVCFRFAPAFPAREVVRAALLRDPNAVRWALAERRDCSMWIDYNPGHDPKDHMTDQRLRSLEDDRRAFLVALDKGGRRLVLAGIITGSIIGVCQILAMTPDSVLYKAAVTVWRLLRK